MKKLLEYFIKWYARIGFCCITLHPSTAEGCGCKDPLCDKTGQHPLNSVYEATSNEMELKERFDVTPIPNVGIVLGPASRILGITYNTTDAVAVKSYQEIVSHFELSEVTMEILSPAKRVLLYSIPEGIPVLPKVSESPEYPGVQLLGDGSFVVAPPSTDPFSRQDYSWGKTTTLAELSRDLIETFIPQKDNLPLIRSDEEGVVAEQKFKDFYSHIRINGVSAAEAQKVFAIHNRALKVPLQESFYKPFFESFEAGFLEKLFKSVEGLEGTTKSTPSIPRTDLERIQLMLYYTLDMVHWVSEKKKYYKWHINSWIQQSAPEIEYPIYDRIVRDVLAWISTILDKEERARSMKIYFYASKATTKRDTCRLFRESPEIRKPLMEFNSNPNIIPCSNATYDLRSGISYSPYKLDFCTQSFGTHYDKDANCPRWLEFLHTANRGNKYMVLYMQMIVGYLLAGGNPLHKIIIIHGPAATGKTTFIEVIQKLFGSFAKRTSINTFSDTRKIRNDLASLQPYRLAIIDENDGEESSNFSGSLIKEVTGGDKIEARFLYNESFEFDVLFKILITTNHLPAFKYFDSGLKRRMILVSFMNRIEQVDQDPSLVEKLEDELPGILNWAIEGFNLVQRFGLQMPFNLQQELEEYSRRFNTVQRFIFHTCVQGHGMEISSKDLYEAFRGYCIAFGEGKPMKEKTFKDRIGKEGYSVIQRKRVACFQGLDVRNHYDLQDESNIQLSNKGRV